MKILIIGPLGAGKSSLAYAINKRYDIPRLNLDEVCRCPADGRYYSEEEQFAKLDLFMQKNSSWVVEGCQRYLYEKTKPNLIIDMRISRWVAIWRFTTRFIKAKKLIGKEIDKDLPVQAYHYRKITLKKIRDYDLTGQEINAEIEDFLKDNKIKTIKCKSYKDYQRVFTEIEKQKAPAKH